LALWEYFGRDGDFEVITHEELIKRIDKGEIKLSEYS